jgi:hypothetical protein
MTSEAPPPLKRGQALALAIGALACFAFAIWWALHISHGVAL